MKNTQNGGYSREEQKKTAAGGPEKTPRAELLAPAGSVESMKAAISAGADAVYMGGSRFGARAYADNPEGEQLLEAIDYAHLHGASLYMTVNTLLKEGELAELYEYLLPFYLQGVDAVIVQDLGVFSQVRKMFPDLAVHASTQMTVTGPEGVRLLAGMGAKRVVAARELSLEEIRQICRETKIEIESFIHGALCYCYSGQCLLSSFIGGRSGNRGRCAQPCRLPYDIADGKRVLTERNGRNVMSLKDLCALSLLPDILDAGVYSLKIEGRMRSPRYTAGVVSIYRKYLDKWLEQGGEDWRVDPQDRKELLELFDRGGQTDGYYQRHNGRDMLALAPKPRLREVSRELYDRIDETYVNEKKQEPVCGRLLAREGKPAELILTMEGRHGGKRTEVRVSGHTVETAVSRPMDAEQLKRPILKTGDTPFVFSSLEVESDENVFLPVQELNRLRRQGIKALEEAVLAPRRRSAPGREEKGPFRKAPVHKTGPLPPAVTVLVCTQAQLEAALGEECVSEIQMESDAFMPERWKILSGRCHAAGKRAVLAMPVIFREQAKQWFEAQAARLAEAGFDGMLIRSLEEPAFLKKLFAEKGASSPEWYADHNLYTFNTEAAEVMSRLGFARLTFPLELNLGELRELRSNAPLPYEMAAYGYLPVMTTAQCIALTSGGCAKDSRTGRFLIDRKGKKLPVYNHCLFCYNTIYNSQMLCLEGMEQEILRLSPHTLRLSFLSEGQEETAAVIRAYRDGFLLGGRIRLPISDYTRGHLKRGVE